MSFGQVEALYAKGELASAKTLLLALHREWHDRPWWHVQIHLWLARIAWQQRQVRRAGWELFAALFAMPVSLIQAHLGVARCNL